MFVRLASSEVVAVVNQQTRRLVNEEGRPGKSRSGPKEWISLNKREARSTVSFRRRILWFFPFSFFLFPLEARSSYFSVEEDPLEK